MNNIFRGFLFFLLTFSVGISWSVDVQNLNTETLIKKLNETPDSYYMGRDIAADEATSTCQKLLCLVKTETDDKIRSGFLLCAAMIEEKNKIHPHSKYRTRSNYFELRDALVAQLEAGKGWGNMIALWLSNLFCPEDLQSCSERIRNVIHSRPEHVNSYSLVLYANLPDNKKKEELDFVNSTLSVQFKNSDALFLHALRARFGDKKSEQALLDRVTDFWKNQDDSKRATDNLEEVLVCAGTEKMMQYAASNIQSKNMVRLPGDVWIREYNICRGVLREKYRDDPTFPLPKSGYSYTDQEIPDLKKWCEKNLKVKYPVPTPSPTSAAAAK
jgi:hypothetical protein